jgi:hypothetical protein
MLVAGPLGLLAFCRDWRFAVRIALAAFYFISANGDFAFAAFCAVHPINPLCCPTPCPIYDNQKIVDFLNEAEEAWQKVEQCRQITDKYISIVTTFGPNGPLVSELRRAPTTVSGVFSTFQASVPGMLKTRDLSNPRAVAQILKAALFEPNSLNVVTLTDRIGRVSLRVATISDEAVNALATGLHGYGRLPDVAADRGQQTVTASKSVNVRNDLAANISARQALVDNLGGLQELLSSWAAMVATASSETHATTMGVLPSSSNSSQSLPLAIALQTRMDLLNRLRLTRIAVNQLDVTTSALTALHNERHAAAVMLAQYPGLWNTVASDNSAIQFRASDAAAAVALLSEFFVDGNSAFQLIQVQLKALDTTGWKDSTKMQAASTSAQAVVQAILVNPQAYGVMSPKSGNAIRSNQVTDALVNSFSSWLEDDKLERFWAPLRQDADSAIASLDQRMKAISDRLGFDISSSTALERETALLAQFNQQMQQIPISSQDGVSGGLAVASYVSAFQTVVTAIQSDPTASNFVTVRWPA